MSSFSCLKIKKRLNLMSLNTFKAQIKRMGKIAILGAGPSGLVAAKEALENGLTPTLFERNSGLGGVWNPRTGCVWNTMHTNISKFTTVFGDTPYPLETEMFPSSSSVHEYLEAYAAKWKIKEHVKFNAEVVDVTPCKDAGWKVAWKSSGSGNVESETFTGVIVATGIFAEKKVPEIRGLETFPFPGIKVLHSKEYKSGEDFRGLNVLTVGGSFSGAEIAGDLANHCGRSYHAFRKPFWILRRYLPDRERDGTEIPVDLLFYTRKFYLSQKDLSESEEEACLNKNKGMLSLCEEQQSFDELKVPEDMFKGPVNVVISDQYLPQVRKKALVPVLAGIKCVHGRTVEFDNGEKIEDIDAIIFATGYQTNVSFFSQDVLSTMKYIPGDSLQPLILFQECVHPRFPNLFFVGMYKGPYFAVMEQQARWACRVLSGKVPLPTKELMEDGLKEEEGIRDKIPRPQFPHPEYVLFADTIARHGKSMMNVKKLMAGSASLSECLEDTLSNASGSVIQMLEFKREEIFKKLLTSPVTPAHYNFPNDPKETLNQMDFVEQVLKQFQCK